MKNLLNRMSFRSKILTILLLITMLLTSYSFFLVQSIEEINGVSKAIEETSIPEMVWLSHWEEELHFKKYIINHDLKGEFCCDFIEEYNTYSTSYHNQIKHHGDLPETLEQLNREIELLDFIILNNVQGLVYFGDQEAAKKYITEVYLPRLVELQEKVSGYKRESLTTLNHHSNQFNMIIKESLWLLLSLVAIAIILSVLFSYRMSASLTKPIENMIRKVDLIAGGKYGLTIEKANQVELQSLTTAINKMSIRLEDSFKLITLDKNYREQILNSLPVGIITIDNRTSDISLNSSADKLLKLKERNLHDLEKVVSEIGNQEFWKLLVKRENVRNIKLAFTTADGDVKQLLISQSELVDQFGMVIGSIFYFVDITETEKLENRMHQTEKLAVVGEIAAGAAHEIRNPLTVIHGFITLMNQSLSKSDQGQFQLELLLKEIERINLIIEEMLLLSKPGAPIKKESYLKDIVEEIKPLITQTICPEEIELSVKLERVPLYVDSIQIKQVFHNLIRNSLEAIGEKGMISIYSEVEGSIYRVYIKDTGPGIPMEFQHSIFEPFSSTKEKGTGLGLTIVHRILENHDGAIILKSSSEEGTVFVIEFPIVETV
ncbi:sensor histidine kinase [Bacillus sp. AK128]